MKHDEQMKDSETKRPVVLPHAVAKDAPADAPVSNRAYSVLEPVQHDTIAEAAGMVDTDEHVFAPIGGMVPLGFRMEDSHGFILADLLPVPNTGDVLEHCQVPIMIDEKPETVRSGEKEIDFGRFPLYSDLVESYNGQEKAVEQVLAVPAWNFINQMLNPAGFDRPNDLGLELYSNLAYLRRGWCEKDERFVQLLPYITFWKKVEDRIQLFVYQRGKGVGEGRLAMNCSVGVGGHVNPVDFLSVQARAQHIMSVADSDRNLDLGSMRTRLMVDAFWSGVMINVKREGSEEIKMTNGAGTVIDMSQYIEDQIAASGMMAEQWLYQRSSFFLDFKASDVERVHLMQSIAIELPADFEVATNEEELIDVGFRDLEILYKLQTEGGQAWLPTPLEHWSRSVVSSLYETIQFLETTKDVDMPASRNIRQMLRIDGHHPMSGETVVKIPQADRWKIGTLAGSFDEKYRFYAMNAFVRA